MATVCISIIISVLFSFITPFLFAGAAAVINGIFEAFTNPFQFVAGTDETNWFTLLLSPELLNVIVKIMIAAGVVISIFILATSIFKLFFAGITQQVESPISICVRALITAVNHIKAFEDITGQSPWTHYVVNGYHFIGASPNYGSMTSGYRITAKWLDKELEKAVADADGKPIFVMTHNQPKNTSYGSEDWGDKTLNAVLSKYPDVINFSGHVHYSLLDERSIWQGEYTVINTQSLSYTELERGKENGTIPPNADDTPMGYIMEFSDNSIDIRRINFTDGNMGYEEKKDMLWSFSLPYENNGKYAFDSREADNKAPVIGSTEGTVTANGDKIILSFAAGTDDDFVHSYKVVIDDKDTKYFFSDFYNGIDNMKSTVELALENDGEPHNYKIYAVDSWGEESEACITIVNK